MISKISTTVKQQKDTFSLNEVATTYWKSSSKQEDISVPLL